MSSEIMPGTLRDLDRLTALDPVARSDQRRVTCIRHALESGTCFVAQIGKHLVGYGVLTHSFYGNGVIELVIVQEEHRRQGVGAALLNDLAERCETAKLFASTNQSNKPMQALLVKCGFSPSGQIDNLDDGDPELIYFKKLW